MHRNSIWISFLLVVLILALWFVVKAAHDVYTYFQMETEVPIHIDEWTVKEEKTDQFVVIAHYHFEYGNKDYKKTEPVGEPYPNPWAADKAKYQFEQKQWTVWINPKQPEKGVLEKKFPLKTAISAVVILGLAIYFFILGAYVGVKNGK